MKNIVVVAHKYLPNPDDELVAYLNLQEADNVLHIWHSFPDSQDRCSVYCWYKKGKIYKECRTRDYRFLPEPLIYIKELFFTLRWVIMSRVKWDYYIGADGLCVFFGLILKLFLQTKKVIYWAIDYVPESRFSQNWKNGVYRRVNNFGYRQSDEVWDLSPRMVLARREFSGIELSEYHKHRVVANGAWTQRIRRYPYHRCEKNTLVFMGHLLPKQGVDMVIKKIPAIIKKNPDFRFKIIGDGKYKDALLDLVKKLNIEKYCIFLGKIVNQQDMEDEIAKSCVSIAPYIKALDTWTYYADPGKVKTYLACGVPILLTDVPWNAQDIKGQGCGEIIKDNGSDLVDKLTQLMSSKNNQKYRNKCIVYAKQFSYKDIFDSLNLLV